MTQRWNGTVFLEPGRLTFHGRIGSAHAHAHAAVQIVIVTSGTVELTDRHGHARPVRGAVIPARALHTVRALDAWGTLVYCDTDSVLGRAVRSRPAAGDRIADWVGAGPPDGPGDLARLVAREHPAGPAHPAVRAATARIRTLLGGPIRLEDVAAAAGISPSRLGHLFAQEVGMSFPTYLRWARLRRAIELVRAGSTLTRAAHGAGFSDSSHLTRVVHEMFGTAPSELLRGLRWEGPAGAEAAPHGTHAG
ncbi:helix-turn-helix transcriptional regulator [Streptomyces sp. NPDC048603]|uniref:helix-turn-helix transcriptional regulator n=1 Tax=Streptomyces sp. NPDC048603 TaxID=3365577 RepID=UPI00372048B8